MNEIWKQIGGYEKLYEVSSFGRVKSLSRKRKLRGAFFANIRERILKPVKDSGGYPKAILLKEGRRKSVNIHRLVAGEFLGLKDSQECEILQNDNNDTT